MQVELANVVQAITNLTSKPIVEPEATEEILHNYVIADNALEISFQILNDDSLSIYHKMYAASYIKNNMNLLWNQFPPDAKLEIRNHFFEFFTSYQSNLTDLRFYELVIQILASYVLFQFPDEFPEAAPIFFQPIEGPQQLHNWKFISTVITLLEKPMNIAPERVQILRNFFMDNSESLIAHAHMAMEHEESVTYALKIYDGILQWANYETIFQTLPLLQRICTEFVYKAKYNEDAIECLTTLFITRSDATQYVSFVPLIITAFGNPNAQFENHQHITSDHTVLNFLERLLNRFLPSILMIYDPTVSESNAQTERTLEIIRACQNNEIDSGTLQECINNILNVIVSQDSVENLDEHYWTFWVNIFYQMKFEQERKSDRFQPLTAFLSPALPQIRQAIYNCVPLDQQDDTSNEDKMKSEQEDGIYTPTTDCQFCSNRSRTAWSILCQLDMPSAIAFLKEQDPSTALCYAIGNLDLRLKKDFDISELHEEIEQLYANVEVLSGEDPRYPVALLYCFSRTMSLSTGGEFFMNFIEFAIKCVNEQPPPICSAATTALYIAARRNEERFLAEESIAENTLFDNAENYLLKLHRDDAVRMFKTISSLISKISTKERMHQCYAQISQPILQALSVQFQPETVFDCIKEASCSAGEYSYMFMEFLWEDLYNAAREILSGDVPLSIIEAVLDTFSQCLANEIYNADRVQAILELMVDRLNAHNFISVDDCFYNFISVIRAQHPQMNEMLPPIIDMFVLPGLQSQHPNLAGMLSMLSQFTFQITDFPWFIELAEQGIDSYIPKDNHYAIECLRSVFKLIRTRDKFMETVNGNMIQPILIHLFHSLTDTLHKESTNDITRLLREIMYLTNKVSLMRTPEFASLLVSSIQEVYPEPQENFYLEFVQKLMADVDKSYQFHKDITDFLILIRVMSPGDADTFKTRKYEEVKEDQLVFGRGKVIRLKSDTGEKIELVPQRKRFRLATKQPEEMEEQS